MPRVSNAFKDQPALQIWRLSKERTDWLYSWIWKFFTVFAESPLYCCPAYLIGADFSDWTVPTLWNSLHENVFRRFTCHVVNSVICSVKEAQTCFDRPGYWMSAICFAKLWKTAFCPRYVSLLKKHRLIVLFTSDVMNKKYKWLTYKRHQICWQNYVK